MNEFPNVAENLSITLFVDHVHPLEFVSVLPPTCFRLTLGLMLNRMLLIVRLVLYWRGMQVLIHYETKLDMRQWHEHRNAAHCPLLPVLACLCIHHIVMTICSLLYECWHRELLFLACIHDAAWDHGGARCGVVFAHVCMCDGWILCIEPSSLLINVITNKLLFAVGPFLMFQV